MKIFAAALGPRERLLTIGVGYGVGIGVPLALAVGFSVGFGQPLILLFPIPFLLVFGAAYFFRPTAFGVDHSDISVLRPVGVRRIPIRDVRAVVSPASHPTGLSIGLARVDGFHGTFGTFWNRSWGRYRQYVTDHRRRVELRLANDSRVILSPDDPSGFVQAVCDAAGHAGWDIETSVS